MGSFVTKIFKNNTKSFLTILSAGLMAAVLVTGTVLADGPTFNIFPIGYTGAQNTDYPMLDGRNVTKGESWSTSQFDHDSGVNADPGDVVEFLVYYHNGAPDAPENTATNVALRATLPAVSGNQFSVGATLSASNAAGSPITSISSTSKGGDVGVRVSGTQGQTLTLVPGTTVWLPNRGSSSQVMSDTVTGGGVNLGSIRGCWDFSGFVKFQVRVSQNVASYGLSLTKEVRKADTGSFGSSVNASPSDTVEFRLVGTNTGTGAIQHVLFTDALPSKLFFVPGSLQVSQTPLSGNLFSGGLDVGVVNPGAAVTVTFRAQLDGTGAFAVGTTNLDNTATVSGQSPTVSPVSASARVVVTINTPQVCTIQVRATLNNMIWSGALNYNISGAGTVNGIEVPKDFTSLNPGSYSAGTPTGGPSGATYSGVSPTSGNCSAGSTLTFTYQFTRVDVASLAIDKTVKNITVGGAFADTANAQPSQTVEFKIVVSNTGNTSLSSVIVRDALPQKIDYVSGTLTIDGSTVTCASCFFDSFGLSTGDIMASGSKTIVFQALLQGQNQFPVGTTQLVNTGYAKATGVTEKSDTATVTVNKAAPQKENGSPSGRPQN